MVLTCVGNDDDLAEVVLGDDGALAAMAPGALFVDHTTVSPAIARQIAVEAARARRARARRAGLGRPGGRRERQARRSCAAASAAGDGRPRARCIEAYAARIVHVGEAGAGQATKIGQPDLHRRRARRACPKACASPRPPGSTSTRCSRRSRAARRRAGRWTTAGDDDRGRVRFRLRGRLDAQGPRPRARRGARARASTLPVTALVDQFYAEVQAMGGGRQDTSALIRHLPRGERAHDRAACSQRSRCCSSPPRALADTLIDNVNGISVDRDGTVTASPALRDRRRRARSSQIARPRRRAPPSADYRDDGRGRTVDPRPDRRPRATSWRSASALLTLDLSDTRSLAEAQAQDRRLCRRQSRPPVDRRARLEPGALGPRPLPDRRRARRGRSPTGRSGSSGSTAMPAGPTAPRCRPPGSPPPPPTRRRADRAARRRPRSPRACSSTRRWSWSPPRSRRRARATATSRCTRRRSCCSSTASPRSPTWAPASRTG